MRTEPEAGEAALFPWGTDSEPTRKDKPSRGNNLQAHRAGPPPTLGEAIEQCERPRCWEALIGKIVAFSPDPQAPNARFCGAVVAVAEAPDYGLLPSCIVTVRGRSGKTMQFDFTKHYAQTHDTWRQAEQ